MFLVFRRDLYMVLSLKFINKGLSASYSDLSSDTTLDGTLQQILSYMCSEFYRIQIPHPAVYISYESSELSLNISSLIASL